MKWLGIAECRVFTPHKIRAELSSHGSSRPASDKKIRAESSSNGSCRESFGQFAGVDAHSSSYTLAKMKDFLLVPSVSVIAIDGSA